MTEPDEAKQYAQSRIHPEMNASVAAPIKDELARAYRAGQAASAERIKALEGRIESRDWAMLGLIAATRNELPESAKEHNIAARLEGIRLGLEAAAREADVDWVDRENRMLARMTVANIRALDPATIAKEASREP